MPEKLWGVEIIQNFAHEIKIANSGHSLIEKGQFLEMFIVHVE